MHQGMLLISLKAGNLNQGKYHSGSQNQQPDLLAIFFNFFCDMRVLMPKQNLNILTIITRVKYPLY